MMKTLMSAAAVIATVGLVGCGEKAKKAEEAVEGAAKEAVEKVENAAQSMEKKVEGAVGHKAEEHAAAPAADAPKAEEHAAAPAEAAKAEEKK